MMKPMHKGYLAGIWGLGVLALLVLGCGDLLAGTGGDSPWLSGLRSHYFGQRPIVESDEVIVLDTPVRAEDAAFVPLKIKAKIPQTREHYIKTITLIIDKNPSPVAGTFHFTPQSGRADLAMRIRVNEYSPVLAIAETSDGRLHMSTRFIKASGGCSAPVGTDLDEAMARLGRMRLKIKGQSRAGEPLQTRLAISHPNLTGLQLDQLTRLYTPARFIKSIRVSFEGQTVFSAETDISISENPNFRFYFVPDKPGELRAEITDTDGARFTKTLRVAPSQVAGKLGADKQTGPN
jgi:sulfur-oxidizing protein SoxY